MKNCILNSLFAWIGSINRSTGIKPFKSVTGGCLGLYGFNYCLKERNRNNESVHNYYKSKKKKRDMQQNTMQLIYNSIKINLCTHRIMTRCRAKFAPLLC